MMGSWHSSQWGADSLRIPDVAPGQYFIEIWAETLTAFDLVATLGDSAEVLAEGSP